MSSRRRAAAAARAASSSGAGGGGVAISRSQRPTPNATAADVPLNARLLPSESGVTDNAAILAILAEQRYDGPVTPAPDKSQFAGMGRDKIVKSCGAALDTIWKAAGLNNAGRLATVSGR